MAYHVARACLYDGARFHGSVVVSHAGACCTCCHSPPCPPAVGTSHLTLTRQPLPHARVHQTVRPRKVKAGRGGHTSWQWDAGVPLLVRCPLELLQRGIGVSGGGGLGRGYPSWAWCSVQPPTHAAVQPLALHVPPSQAFGSQRPLGCHMAMHDIHVCLSRALRPLQLYLELNVAHQLLPEEVERLPPKRAAQQVSLP